MRKNFTSCLKQVITLQKPIIENDEMGGQTEKWEDFKIVRAEAKALYEKGIGEIFASMQIMDNAFYSFKIRFMEGINSKMRIIYNQKTFKIKRITNHNEENIMLIILTQEWL